MKIYLVTGYTGEYENRHKWNVKAFSDVKIAENLQAAANKHADEYFKQFVPDRKAIDWDALCMYESPFDPHAHMDYTGTSYDLEEIDLET